ncbi:TraR/DksA family transcriptional regulator [Aeromicrobium sp. CF4.19]|uniref:TraR/DksA family transcriptional regulator n=1 Tax=Aeromicrobium sp. CF4.19 TaxID=3373082 RepID=UPI003EE5F8A7
MDARTEETLTAHRAEAARHLAVLEHDLEGVVEASRSSNADDEHDPEGATIAFEREQLSAFVDRARRRIHDLDAALARLADGSYGVCTGCGSPVGAERLEALPAVRTCRGCA